MEAATRVLDALNNGEAPDMNSWSKWDQALLRDVFYEDHQRTSAQFLENMMRQGNADYRDGALGNCAECVRQWIEECKKIPFYDDEIIYEPPFDLTIRHY